MKNLKILLLISAAFLPAILLAQENNALPYEAPTFPENGSNTCVGCCCIGKAQTPLGVMTDHIHDKGQWMVSYTYMNTNMQGNIMGTQSLSDNAVYNRNYMMAPKNMAMQMHMVMTMYGITDKLTVMAMCGFMTNNMNMNMDNMDHTMIMNGVTMTMSGTGKMNMQSTSSGITDTRVYALYNFSDAVNRRIIGSFGVSLPTGSVNQSGTTMLGDNQRLAYDMQTGTGSLGINPDITYVRKYGLFYWGANIGADIKLNYNAIGFKFGNMYHATVWTGYQLLPFVSFTLRGEDVNTEKISGFDPKVNNVFNQLSDPTTKTTNYGGQWVNVYVGLNFHVNRPELRNFSGQCEFGMPVYQNVNGIQMALHSNFLAGVGYTF